MQHLYFVLADHSSITPEYLKNSLNCYQSLLDLNFDFCGGLRDNFPEFGVFEEVLKITIRIQRNMFAGIHLYQENLSWSVLFSL